MLLAKCISTLSPQPKKEIAGKCFSKWHWCELSIIVTMNAASTHPANKPGGFLNT